MLTQSYTASSGPSTITNTYDIVGRVLTTTEGGTSLTYTYDNLGRNTSFEDQAGLTSTYTYDLDGNRLTSTYPTGVEVKRYYDASNRLHYLKDGSDTTMATYGYDILDRVTGTSLANGTSVTYGYDLLNRISYVNNTLGSGNRNYSYVYDNASRRSSETEPRGTITYGYSYRNELTGITEPSGSPFANQGFAYDYGYNRSGWTQGETGTSYTVNTLNQYTAVGSASPTWNTDGGLATFSGNTYTYDSMQRLTEVDYSGGKTLFSYDPLGRRVKKVDENSSGAVLSTFSYHYDGSEVAVEYQPSTTWTYYLGLGVDQVVMRDSGSAKQWYYRDALGSISAIADNSGDLLEGYEYNAQGQFQVTNASGTAISGTAIANDILYTGREYDDETGNYFYRARYYNPTLGRFISRDPLSGAEFSQGTNLYAYCQNNYLNLTDPTGKSWASFGYNVAMGAAVGVAVTAAIIVAAPVIAAAAAEVGTAALIAAGVEAATATTVVDAGLTGIAGGAAVAGMGLAGGNLAYDVAGAQQSGNWDSVGYDIGNIGGGLGAGVGYSGYSGSLGEMGGYDPDFNGRVSSGEISQFENDLNWWATKPSDQSGALSAGAASLLMSPAAKPCDKNY